MPQLPAQRRRRRSPCPLPAKAENICPIRALPSLIRGGHPLRAAQDSYRLAALVRFISSPQFFS
jgi:hypothetical protein